MQRCCELNVLRRLVALLFVSCRGSSRDRPIPPEFMARGCNVTPPKKASLTRASDVQLDLECLFKAFL
jgi:hypothetical protein